jgi:branched-subunit amino acid transport protein
MTQSTGAVWATILLLAVGTFFLRFAFIHLLGKIEVPETVHRLLRFIPAAVLPAIILPAVYNGSHEMDLCALSTVINERSIAAACAIYTAWRWKNALLSIVLGMVVLWVGKLVM